MLSLVVSLCGVMHTKKWDEFDVLNSFPNLWASLAWQKREQGVRGSTAKTLQAQRVHRVADENLEAPKKVHGKPFGP